MRTRALRLVVASAALASAVQLGCGPALDDATVETAAGMETTGEQLLDELDVPGEGEAAGGMTLEQYDGDDGRDDVLRGPARICHFALWWDRDHANEGRVLQMPWRTARRHLHRHGDCVVAVDDMRAGDSCAWNDCRDWDDGDDLDD